MEPKTTNKNSTTNLPWDLLKHFYFVSLSPTSECRFSSNRLKCVAYHLSTPNASFYFLMSLLLTTTVNLWTTKNFPASLQGVWSPRLDFLGEMSTSDTSFHDHLKDYNLFTLWIILFASPLLLLVGFSCLHSFFEG